MWKEWSWVWSFLLLAPVDASAGSGLWARSCCTAPCPALQSLVSVAVSQAVWQHMKASTGKCEVSCIRRNNFKLLAHFAGCEINCSGKKKSKHLGIIIDTSSRTSALYRALGWKRKEIFSSPNDQWIPWSTGMDIVCKANFHPSVHLWTHLTDNRWLELAAWNPVAFPVHFMSLAEVTPHKTKSLKASLLEMMMMEV